MTDKNLSIHPRNWPNMKDRKKKNTCAERKESDKGILGKMEENLTRRRTAMAATMKNAKNPTAFRMPGTMRGW